MNPIDTMTAAGSALRAAADKQATQIDTTIDQWATLVAACERVAPNVGTAAAEVADALVELRTAVWAYAAAAHAVERTVTALVETVPDRGGGGGTKRA